MLSLAVFVSHYILCFEFNFRAEEHENLLAHPVPLFRFPRPLLFRENFARVLIGIILFVPSRSGDDGCHVCTICPTLFHQI